MPSSKVIEAIAVTAELCGRTFTPAAAMMFASDLDGFPDDAVLAALTRCRKEVKGFLTIAEVVTRIDDGRPGPEQAWSMIPQDEHASVVWSNEMAQAYGVAQPLLAMGDRIGARMAFKESYAKLISDARDNRESPEWKPSFGVEVSGRQAALIEAVRHNRMALHAAVALLPADAAEGLLISLQVKEHPMLTAPSKAGLETLKTLLLTMNTQIINEPVKR